MKINITKKDVIWSYAGTILSMASNLMMLPFIIYYLDKDMLGLWYIFTSIGTIATLFDFGFAVTFARNITYCWSGADKLTKENVSFVENREPNYFLMKKVLYTCKWIYFIISSVALLLILTLGTAYVMYVSREISGYKHMIAWFIFAFSVFLNLYYGYYSSFLRGVGAVYEANKNTVIARTLQIVLSVLLLVMGTGIIGVSIASLVYGTLFRVLGKYKFFHYKGVGGALEKIQDRLRPSDVKDLFYVVWHNAWRDGAILISNYFSNQASILICSMYLSLAETGVYSIGLQIALAISTIAGTLYTTYQPALQEAFINQNIKKMKETMSLIVMSFIFLFIFGTIGVLLVGLPLLRLVNPDTIISVPALLGLCVYQFMLNFRNCYTSYFSCTNRIPYMRGFIVSAVLSVAFSVVMIGPLKMGVYGLILAGIISQAIYNVWVWPFKAHQELKLSFLELCKNGTFNILTTIKRFLPSH